MPLPLLQPGAEPVPGYRLRRRIGHGNFGEVWEAESDRGFRVALKLVLRDRLKQFEEELTALEVMRSVHHPNLIAVFDAWHTDDYLVIAMELADRSLWDRFQEERRQGRTGIPRPQLLDYLNEAAKALDYLNEPRPRGASPTPVSIQHRDIKPQNILLMGGGVKVADFGLVTPLEHSFAERSFVGTLPYSAPEVFQGKVGRWSDQYSLAVTYCHLRGGRLPFDGDPYQILQAHYRGEPDLGMIPAEERPAVGRALAANPRDRWPNCLEFVAALRAADAAAAPTAVTAPPLPSPPPPAETLAAPAPERKKVVPAWRDPAAPPDRRRPEPDTSPRRGGWAVAGLVVVVLLAGAGYWHFSQPPSPDHPDGSPRSEPPVASLTTPGRRAQLPVSVPGLPPAPKGRLEVEGPPGPVEGIAGSSVTVPVHVRRVDLQGAVQLTLPDLPPGVSADPPAPLAAGKENAELTVAVAPGVSPGTMTLKLVAAAGPVRGEASLTLTVRRPPHLALRKPAPVTVQAGTGVPVTVGIDRDGFDGDVTVQLAGAPPGVTLNRGQPVRIPAGTRQVLTNLTVDAAVAPGTVTLELTARSGSLRDTAELNVEVLRAARVTLSLQPDALDLLAGEGRPVTVRVKREAFQGPVQVRFQGGPAGLDVLEATIPANADQVVVSLKAGPETRAGDAIVRAEASAGRATGAAELKVWVRPPAGPAVVRRPERPGPAVPQTYAVLVGIGAYADRGIRGRPHAEDDARALYDLVTDPDRVVGEVTHVRLLLGRPDRARPSEPATRESILRAAAWLQEAGPGDLVLFAYFGTGGAAEGRRCYFAADSTAAHPDRDAVAAADLGEALARVRSRHVAAFVDAGFKGYGADEYLGPPGRVVFAAATGPAPGPDLDRHGAFAQVLLDGLGGRADREGGEADGLVTVDELTAYVREAWPPLLRQHGRVESDPEAGPQVQAGRGSHFALVANPVVTVRARLGQFEALARAKKLAPGLLAEGRELLGRMPKREDERWLRRAYQALADGKTDAADFPARRDRVLAEHRLTRAEAEAFARAVGEAIELVRARYVEEVDPGELAARAVGGLYRALDEEEPPGIVQRLAVARKLGRGELTALLADARQALGKRADLDDHQDVDVALQRMLLQLDPPYSGYEGPAALRLAAAGIGASVRTDPATGVLEVLTPIKGGPAFRAGIRAGDRITTITRATDGDGNPLPGPEVTPTRDVSLDEAVRKVLGRPGTHVTLTVERPGGGPPRDLDLTRGRFEAETVFGVRRKPDADWEYLADGANRIAYIRLGDFAGKTAEELDRVVGRLERDGLKGLVLDLRFTRSDGSLGGAVAVAGLFLSGGRVVTVRPRAGKEEVHDARPGGGHVRFPMACLVNGGTEGLAEVVAACLQDHGRAKVVGERSYGKGTLQETFPLDGGRLRLTTATLERPSGKNLNPTNAPGRDRDDWGVRPDKGCEVRLSGGEEALREHLRGAEVIYPPGQEPREKAPFRDEQLEKALDYLRHP